MTMLSHTDKHDKKQLSILIPTYNDACYNIVEELHRQACEADIDYEIIVADDGSTDENTIQTNARINNIPQCSYITRNENRGRAAIRNFLANTARYDRLLFMDCDMALPDNLFISRYINEINDEADVIDGHTRIHTDDETWGRNLRYITERAAAPMHSVEMRQRTPYQSFATANFMIRRETMLAHPFDERFKFYGYEDVLLGKELYLCGARIKHIDNPVLFKDYEPNGSFVAKTEEAMHTLHRFKTELQGYSRLLTLENKLRHIAPAIRLWHMLFGKAERRILTGSSPNMTIFNLYRLGYYLSIKE